MAEGGWGGGKGGRYCSPATSVANIKVDGMPNIAHIYFRILKEFVVSFIFHNAFSSEIREEFCSASIILSSD